MRKAPINGFYDYVRRQQKRKAWQRVVSTLVFVVVFCTTYALILPAITASTEANCGYEEHVHLDSCYEMIESSGLGCTPVHTHTDECYDENEALICGVADYVLHTHGEYCYDAEGNLTCQLAEIQAHTHEPACFTVSENGEDILVCGLEETEGHAHAESCYDEESNLICELEEAEAHTHTEECYCTSGPICGLEELIAHTHEDACYDEEGNLTCVTDEIVLHSHDDTCYEDGNLICQLEAVQEHIHTAACYDARCRNCGLEEITAHTHDAECFDEAGSLICSVLQVTEHQHTAECMQTINTRGDLLCELEEHIHEEECYESVLQLFGISLFSDTEEDSTSDTTSTSTSIFDVDKSVAITASGVTYDPATDQFKFELNLAFELTQEELKKYSAFHIDLPDDVIVPDSLLGIVRSATDTNKGGVVSFEYWFEKLTDENGDVRYVIHAEFLDSYIEKLTENDTTNHTIDFSAYIDKDAYNDDGSIDLEWSNGTVTTISKEDISYPSNNETVNYDIYTSKTSSYDAATGKLTYTVKVYTEKGTPNPITVTDVLNLNGLDIDSFDVTGVTITNQNGDLAQGYSANYSDGNLTITNLAGLAAGEYYLITYVYDLGEVTPGETYYPQNTVKASAEDTTAGKTIESTSGTYTAVTKDMVSKTGVYDAETGLITWIIVVNAAGDNIAGYALTDDMMNQNIIKSLSVSPNEGVTLSMDSNGQYTLTFNAINDGVNTNTYTVTYTTAHDPTTANNKISNTAVLTDAAGKQVPSSGGTADVTVPMKGSIAKTGVMDPDTGLITWTVTIAAPEGGIGAGTVISDTPGWQRNHYLNQEQIFNLNATIAELFPGVSYTLEFSNDEWTWQTYADALAEKETTKYLYWRLTINEDVPSYANQDVSITYTSTADMSSAASTYYFYNQVNMGNQYATAEVQYQPSVVKMDSNYNTGYTYISSTDGVVGWFIKITPTGDQTQINITDTLPEGVTFTKLGFGTDGNSAKSNTSAAAGTLTSGSVKTDWSIENSVITATITHTDGTSAIPYTSDLYLYVQCQITSLPEVGSSASYILENKATVDSVEVTQTQHVTVNRPATVLKTDGNGSSSDTKVSYNADNKTLSWLVRIYLEEATNGTITLTDTLPDGVTLTKLGYYQNAWGASYYAVTIADSAEGTVVDGVSYAINGQTVTVSTDIDYLAGAYIYVYFEGTYNECEKTHEHSSSCAVLATLDTGETGYVFKNTAEVKVGDTSIGSDDQTQTIIKETAEENTVVNKESNWDSGINQLQYTVLINEEGMDLAAGSDTLTVTDVMSHSYNPWWQTMNSTLISSSVNLYYAQKDTAGNILTDSSGNYLLGEEVDPSDWSWTFSNNFTEIQYTNNDLVNTITAIVPDGETLILTYIYEVSFDADWDTDFSVSNSVTVSSDTPASDNVYTNDKWVVSDVSASSTSSGAYTIHKVQQGNYNITLPGAEFTVYLFEGDQPLTDSDGNPVVYVSDEDGLIQVSKGQDYYEDDVVYYIVETKAPDGYDLPAEPTKYYFYFSGDNKGSYSLPTGAVDLSENFGVAYVQNEQEAEHAIAIDKLWLDADGETIKPTVDSITFHLIQKDYKGTEEHFFHNTLKNGIQIYAHHSVIWTAPASGEVKLSVTNVEIHDLLNGAEITLTDGEFTATEGTPYQIMLSDDDTNELTWTYTDNSDSGKLTLDAKEWSVSVVVPDQDNEGYDYTYTAREVAVTGYTSEITTDADGNITITNRQQDTTSVTVNKAWYDDTMEKEPVTFQLYQSVDKLYTDYVAYLCYINGDQSLQIGMDSPVTFTTNITGTGDYSITWDLSLYGFKDSEGAEAFYIDIADPEFALDGYTLSNISITTDLGTYNVTSTPVVSEHGGGYTRINFYNIYDDVLNMDANNLPAMSADGFLTVNFTLTAPANDPNSGVLPALNAYLPSANAGGVAYGDPVTLNGTWSNTWTGLPLTGTDANGNAVNYSYYVKELTSNYDVRYSNQYAVDGGSITVTNYPKTTADLTVNKQWQDYNGNLIDPPEDSVTYELEQEELAVLKVYRGGWGWANEDVVYVKPGTTITLTFVGNSLVEADSNYTQDGDPTFIGVIKYGEYSTALYEYTYTRTITADITSIGMSYGGYPTLVVDNKWVNSVGYDIGTYDLYDWNGNLLHEDYYLGDYTLETPEPEGYTPQFVNLGTFTLSELNDWTYTHQNLIPAIYRVTETTTGYTTTYKVGDGEATAVIPELTLEAGDEETVTIINKLSTISLTVNKQWWGAGEYNSVMMLTFKVYQKLGENAATLFGTYTITPDSSGNWSYTVDGLPKADAEGNEYTYYIEETGLTGFLGYYSNGTANDKVKPEAVTVSGADGTITITNRPVTEIGVDKKWATGTTPGNVVVALYQVSTPAGEGVTGPSTVASGGTKMEDKTVTLGENTGDGWDKTWKNLPLYEYDTSGNITHYYSYYVVEESNGYIATYSTNEAVTSGRITITNAAFTTSVSVDKIWTNGSSDSVDVSLYQQYIASTHTHSYTSVVTAPTCTAQGYTTYTCSCGASYTADSVAALGHNYSVTGTTSSTCTTQGYTTYTCSTCGYSYNGDYTALAEHSWDEGVVTKEATETEDGIKTYTCTVCGATKEVTIPASHTHSYTAVVTDPTCTEQGYTTYTCTCGDSYVSDYTDAAGHKYNNYKVCTVCGVVEAGYGGESLRSPYWGSAYTDGIEITECLTTITFKSTTYEDANENWFGPLYYLYTGSEAKVNSTAEGYKEYWVQRVDDYGWIDTTDRWDNTQDLANVGITYSRDENRSDWTNFLNDLKAGIEVTITTQIVDGKAVVTMDANGVKTTVTADVSEATNPVYLSLTGEKCTLTDIVASTAHTSGAAVTENNVAATCTTAGSYDSVVYCTVCNEELSRTTTNVDALGHDFCTCDTKDASDACAYCVYTAPTADTDGSIVRTCKRDGCSETDTEILDATGGDSGGATTYTVTIKKGKYGEPYETVVYDKVAEGSYVLVTYVTFENYGGITVNNNSATYTSRELLGQLWGSNIYEHSYQATVDKNLEIVVHTGTGDTSEIVSGVNVNDWNSEIISTNSLMLMSLDLLSDDDSSTDVALNGTFISTQTVTPGTATTWTDLPLFKLDENGNIIGYYTYYAVETGGTEYDATYTYTNSSGSTVTESTMTEGITSGTILITNNQEYGYELPSTGGSGTFLYTLGGIILLMMGCAVLMYNHKKGRKGVTAP